MDDVTSPVLAQARDVGQVVDESGGDDEAAGVELPGGADDGERAVGVPGRTGRGGRHDRPAVAADLLGTAALQLERADAVAGQEVVDAVRGGVPGVLRVEHGHAPPGAAEGDGGGQAGGATADDEDVEQVGVRVSEHGRRVTRRSSRRPARLPVRQDGVGCPV